MKQKDEGFTLVEAVIVLGIFSLLLGLGLAIRPQTHRQTVRQFEGQFASLYQRARLEAQSKQKKVVLSFQKDGLATLDEKVLYPDNYRLQRAKDWFIQPTGYVAPDHVAWQNGHKEYRLIMQLGVAHIALKVNKQPGFVLVEGILALGLITAAVIFELTIFQQYQENQQRLLAVNQQAINGKIQALADWQHYLNQVAQREEEGKHEA